VILSLSLSLSLSLLYRREFSNLHQNTLSRDRSVQMKTLLFPNFGKNLSRLFHINQHKKEFLT